MKHQFDILIIGAGMAGISCAYYLTKQGYKVAVVEKGDVGSGCSYGNAGLVVPSHAIPLAAPGVIAQRLRWLFNPESPFYIKIRFDGELIRWLWQFFRCCNESQVRRAIPIFQELHLASLGLFEELAAQKELDFEFYPTGMLTVFKSREGWEKGIKEVYQQKTDNLKTHILKPEEVRDLAPMVRSDMAGGVYYANDAHLNPYAFVRELAQSVQEKGGKILISTEVIGFKTSQHRVKTVHTTRGDFSADKVVLAGGAWSGEMVRDLELNIPIQAAKGYSITYKRPDNCPKIPIMLAEAKVILTPLRDILRIGGTLEMAGFDMSINRRRIGAILRAVPAYLEIDPTRFKLREIWRGLRPCSPDGFPYLGASRRYSNLIIAAGHAMKGISLGPITGKLVSQIVSGEQPFIDLSLMRIERFI